MCENRIYPEVGWQLVMPLENKGDLPEKKGKKIKQMQQLSAKNGNGNKSSCSFSLPVSPLKAR